MGTTRNYLKARDLIERVRLVDAVAGARKRRVAGKLSLPRDWPKPPTLRHSDRAGIERLLRKMHDDPSHPANWHARVIAEQMRSSCVREIYFRIRRELWTWREFAGLRPGARAILEAVIELAREEAFPWYVMVPAEQVRAIARLSEGRYATSVRELECMAISRPARLITADASGFKGIDRSAADDDELPPIAQWVVRYRRGVPWNAKRAAWWINYDLLCQTGRVLDCFAVSPLTLSAPYLQRNVPMGRVWPGVEGGDRLEVLRHVLAMQGPLPPAGFRAALWRAPGLGG